MSTKRKIIPMDNDRMERVLKTRANSHILTYVRSPFLDQYETWLFMVSFGIALFLGISTPFYYTAESDQYLKMAWYILGDARGEYLYHITPGFPLLMIVTGVPFLESFWGLIAVHVIMGSIIPVLAYRTFVRYNSVFAKVTASLTLASLVTYKYMTHILPEQGMIFLLFLSVLFFSQYLKSRSRFDIILLTLVLFLIALFQPAASLMIVPFFVVLCLAKPRSWLHVFLSLAMFVCLALGYSAIRANVLNPPGNPGYTAAIGGWSGISGRLFFWNIYGPARTFNYGRPVILTSPKFGLTNEENKELFNKTTPENFSQLSSILDDRFGAVEADKIFLNMALQRVSGDWSILFVFWDSFVQFFFGYDLNYDTGKRNPKNPIFFGDRAWTNEYNSSYLSERMQGELSDDIINLRKYNSYIWGPIKLWQFLIKISVAIIGIILLSCWWCRELHYLLFLNVLIIGYQAGITVIFANPAARYVEPVLPMMLIVASGGVYYCIQQYKGR